MVAVAIVRERPTFDKVATKEKEGLLLFIFSKEPTSETIKEEQDGTRRPTSELSSPTEYKINYNELTDKATGLREDIELVEEQASISLKKFRELTELRSPAFLSISSVLLGCSIFFTVLSLFAIINVHPAVGVVWSVGSFGLWISSLVYNM